MPSTVSLTPQQQASVDAANQTLASAQKAYDSSLSIFNSVRDNFCNGGWWNYLKNCDIRNVQSKATKALIGITGPIGWLINEGSQKKWSKPSSCDDAIEKGIILKWECKAGSGDCKSKEGCDNRVNEYNSKLGGYYSAASQLDGAKQILNSAKDNLNTVLDAISKDPTVSANENIIKGEIDAQKSKDMIKWLFFGLAAVLIVGGAIFIGLRILGGRASA